eukprot:scaffold199852_cov44-Tisochrysis_lutea.AAC.1
MRVRAVLDQDALCWLRWRHSHEKLLSLAQPVGHLDAHQSPIRSAHLQLRATRQPRWHCDTQVLEWWQYSRRRRHWRSDRNWRGVVCAEPCVGRGGNVALVCCENLAQLRVRRARPYHLAQLLHPSPTLCCSRRLDESRERERQKERERERGRERERRERVRLDAEREGQKESAFEECSTLEYSVK